MRGTITIKADGTKVFSIDLRMIEMSTFNKLMIIDGLVEAFRLSDEDRMNFGATIAVGGIKAVTGMGPEIVSVPRGLWDIMKKEGNTNENAEN